MSRASAKRSLPISPPFAPMEALTVGEIPGGNEWQYEPKWDGFRCIVFKNRDAITLQSKAGKPLTRYFPDVVAAVRELPPKRFVLDGEIVVPVDGSLSFDELLLRIHPASSRVITLASKHPALLLVFDLLVDARGKSLLDRPLAERRERLEQFAARYLEPAGRVRLSPSTRRLATARVWFRSGGGGLDGVIAKRVELPYRSGDRTGMQKIKRIRTADCVVGGFRYATKHKVVGSLLLGLYDDAGELNHVGFTSSLSAEQRKALTPKLERLIRAPGFTGRAPGGPSRWSTARSAEWQPLAPKLVAEVQYDHFTGDRFRHGTKFLRWRPDKAPRQCTMDQIERGGAAAKRLLEGKS